MDVQDAVPTSRHTARAYGEIDRVIVFAELLATAMELLEAETLAKDRLGLVAVDNLADLLLHRHAERVFESSEGSWLFSRAKFSSTERHRIRKNFDRLLRLAQSQFEGPWGRDVEPILTEDDAAIVRVAHSYRNGVYHDDRHNPAVLSPLIVLCAQAVGRAFVLSYPEGIGCSIGEGQHGALSQLGYSSDTSRDEITTTRMFNFREGAQQIVDHLVSGWEVPLSPLRTHLATDIHNRAYYSATTVVQLLEDGMPDERLEYIFWWSQFWEAHGADSELQRLDSLRADFYKHRAESTVDSTSAEREAKAEESNKAYIARTHELQRAYKPKVNWADAPRFSRLGDALQSARNMSSLISRYEKLDADLGELEKGTHAAVSAWNAICEQAVQTRRGN